MSLFSFSSSSSSLDRSTPARSPARERARTRSRRRRWAKGGRVWRGGALSVSRVTRTFSDLLVVDCLSPDALELPYVSLDLASRAR
ncbi:unnamed protein product [Sphagnum jensenii]|uniref:Uncharacterized protein n=1 Tax=Sphagnum jensenii TaxID=128206 RepID=A0ABP1B841_9BRYO